MEAETTDGALTTLPVGAPTVTLALSGAACPDCLGDADGNRVKDFVDITAILTNWGAVGTAGPPGNIGDANYDGVVDFGDINAVIAHWGVTCP